MAKRIPMCCFVAFFAMLLLSGCSSLSADNFPSDSSVKDSLSPTVDAFNDGEPFLTTLTSFDGSLIPGFSTPDGFYEILSSIQGKNIYYTDYASMSKIILCNRPECKHSDATCTGFLSGESAEIAGLFVWENKLYVNYAAPSHDGPLTLCRMDLNGSNREVLYTFAPAEYANDPVIADTSSLYFVIDTLRNENGSPVSERKLVRFDLTSKEMQALYTLASDEFLMGYGTDGFLFRKNLTDFSYAAFKLTLSGERKELNLTWDLAKEKIFYASDACYLLNDTMTQLTCFDLASETSTIIPLEAPLSGAFSTSFFDGFHDGRLLFIYDDGSGTWKQAGIDVASGATVHITLRGLDLYEKPTRPMYIIAETSEQFLVETGTVAPEHFKRALIAKQDFWSSVPNYQDITFNE